METNKICGNCKFWGDLRYEVLKIEREDVYPEYTKLLLQKQAIKDFETRPTAECQKVSNATKVPMTFHHGTNTVLKETDRKWNCQLWEQKDNKPFVIKKLFKDWVKAKNEFLEITKYPEGVVMEPNPELMKYSIFKPSTWKNKGYIQAFKHLTESGGIVKWNGHEVTEEEFETMLAQCETNIPIKTI